MFKLESYITPILLNYVAKYVKDIRDEDAQVSLWEGEATFHNLDMRLEVLEEELNLPFELVSGHIHELTIQVPWTKLMSEPIRIIINTIEFVGKLRDNDSENETPTRARYTPSGRQSQTLSNDSQQQPTGSSMVNKIINNICVECRNIILKYVEDDIVVSMNVQLLTFGSADQDWKPAMVDVHPTNVVIRKTVQVSDLTICLDKRNAAGRIDVCQEPVLYRCTMECRILYKYNINTVATTTTLRIGLYTKSLDINVASLQFPMVMRLVSMLLEMKSDGLEPEQATEHVPERNIEPISRGNEPNRNKESYFSWAWNRIPGFDSSRNENPQEEQPGHTTDFGVYAEELNFQLKNSEYINDPAMGGMKRIRYTPIMRISLCGIYYERSSVKERDWGNVRAGLSGITVEPLGSYRTNDESENTFVNTDTVHYERAFIDKSLFDEKYIFAEKSWCTSNYEDYTARITDEYMLFRSPVLAFDVVEYKARKSKVDTADTSDDRENPFRVQYRFLSAGITFHYSQAFHKVKNVISDLIDSHYPEYYTENVNIPTTDVDNQGSDQGSMDELKEMADFESIISETKNCNYRFDLREIRVHFYPKHLPDTQQLNIPRSNYTMNLTRPYLRLNFGNALGTFCVPQQATKIVLIVINLQIKPRELLDVCYSALKFNITNVTLTVLNTTPENGRSNLLTIPSLKLHYSPLLEPHLWKPDEAATSTLEANCDVLTLEFSKRELMIASRVVALLNEYNSVELAALDSLVAQASITSDIFKLHTNCNKLRLNFRKYSTYTAWLFSIRAIMSEACHKPMNIHNPVFSSSKGIQNKWFELQLQLPAKNIPYENNESSPESEVQLATMIGIWMEPVRIIIDMYLLEFLSFQECQNIPSQKGQTTETEPVTTTLFSNMPSLTSIISNETSRRQIRNVRKISQPEETVHLSSERDEKIETEFNTPENLNEKYSLINIIDCVEFLKKLVITLDMGQSHIKISEQIVRQAVGAKVYNEYTNILLPKVKLRSMYGDTVLRSNIRQKVHIPVGMRSSSWTINLTDMELQYRRGETNNVIIAPIRTTIIAALTHKINSVVKPVVPAVVKPQTKKVAKKIEEDSISMQSYTPRTKKVDWRDNLSLREYINIDEEEDIQVVSLNLHADTSDIRIYGHCLKELYDHMRIAHTVFKCLTSCDLHNRTEIPAGNTEPSVLIVQPGEDNPILKEFVDIDQNIFYVESEQREVPSIALIVFFQWTIPRIQVELESVSERKMRKIIVDCEDILLNVDKHLDFTKYSSKLQNFSLTYYENSYEGWELSDSLSIRMISDSTNLPLLSVIITSVGLKDLHYRIGARNIITSNQTMSEVLIAVLPLEFVLDLDQMVEFFIPLCELVDLIRGPKVKSNEEKSTKPETVERICDMPMVHLNSKGCTIFLPLETGKEDCSVMVLRVDSIDITPNLDNPLQRNAIRSDVFNKAAQLGMLGTPGALIEDRQYELSLSNISMYTGSWLDILGDNRRRSVTSNENPAFEWNNQINQSERVKSDLIFKDFTIAAIYAPPITYKNILICGQCIEFNCASDFVSTLNVNQVNLLSCILLRIKRFSSIVETTCTAAASSKYNTPITKKASFETLITKISEASTQFRTGKVNRHPDKVSSVVITTRSVESLDNPTVNDTSSKVQMVTNKKEGIPVVLEETTHSDSGIQLVQISESTDSTPASVGVEAVSLRTKRHIPKTISFVAGVFIIKIFDILPMQSDDSEEKYFRPLICCTLAQPSFMFTQNVHDATHHASIFDLNIHVPNYRNLTQDNLRGKNLQKTLFPESLVDTHPGDVNSSGIPPPLFTYKATLDRYEYLEVDVKLRKPIIVHCQEDNLQYVASDFLRIYTALLESSCLSVRTTRPLVRCSKLGQLKLQFLNSDRFRFVSNRIVVKFSDNKMNGYKCKAVCADVMCNLKFSNKPEKAVVKASLGTFYLQTENKVFIHPIAARLSADLITEQWYTQPLVNTSLKFNTIHLDVGIMMLLHLRKAFEGIQRILNYIEKQWNRFLRARPSLGTAPNYSQSSLQELKLPVVVHKHKTKANKFNDEFYQDDLRAGAFQFVDLSTDAVLPLPYQIQIIKKNFGIICWRYPQPRRMVRIEIFPVPMPVNNPIKVRCRMEYFSEAHETFLHFCDFFLSETSAKLMKLPNREICANIWRVVIMQSLISVNGECFDNSEEDDELQSIASANIDDDFKNSSDNDFILHPKVLVGCMRVDTAFQPKVVPKFQLLLSCDTIIINFLNQPDFGGILPPQLEYQQAKTSGISQTFLAVHFERFSVHNMFYNKNDYSVELGYWSRIKCLDYGFLNMLDLLEPLTMQCFVRVNNLKRLVEANFLLDKFRLNFGPSILHSLLISKQHWTEHLKNMETVHAFLPKCIVINRTQSNIAFGQSGTNERIHLHAMQFYLYHFRSDYHSQNLTIFMETEKNEISASESIPIPFKLESGSILYHLRIGNKCITVKICKLSNTQVYVLIKGQIEIVSMVPHEFVAEFRCENAKYEDELNPVEYQLPAKGRTTFYRSVERNCNLTMRLKLNDGNGRGRTGDIPLKTNNSLPWLVKVPLQQPYQFISIWARILREDMPIEHTHSFQPQKLLITIWPIYEVCNMLSCDISVTENTTENTLQIEGEGGCQVLSTPTTHLTEHQLNFIYPTPLGNATTPDYTLMLKDIDWHKFFDYDEKVWTIEESIERLRKPLPDKWPLQNDYEELRVRRLYKQVNAMDVNYRSQVTREFSCTLGLEVGAWGVFINATCLNVSIYVPTTRQRFIFNSNHLEMMTVLARDFTIDVPFGTNWIPSLPIYLEDIADTANRGSHLVLNKNSSIDVVIVRNEEVIKLVFELKIENERHVFKLRPKFVLANFTKFALTALPLAMDHKETSTRSEVEEMDAVKKNRDLPPSLNNIGVTLDIFYDIHARKAKRSSDTAFVYFVCFLVGGNADVSIPISLAMPFTRRCFSVQNGNDSIPLVVTLIEQNGIFYLCVFKDSAPALVVSNHTKVKFIVAQTSASGNSNVTNTTMEFMGKHFDWFQLVAPQSKCYYTPPEMYANFPDVEYSVCNLSLAIFNENDPCERKKIGWSKPIRTDRTWKKFLHVPKHGDVKVVVCDKHRVIRVSIYYISQQMEFSVKDLRSRLLTAPKTETYTQPRYDTEPLGHVSQLEVKKVDSDMLLAPQASECIHFSNDCITKRQLKVYVFVKQLVLSLQSNNVDRDYMKTEVCNLYTDDLMLEYNDTDDNRTLTVLIPNLQIDNQVYSTGKYDFPVLLCGERLYQRTNNLPQLHHLQETYREESEKTPMARLTFEFYQDEIKLNSIDCKFSPFRVYIEDSYITTLLEALVDCEPSGCIYLPKYNIERISMNEGQALLAEQIVAQAQCIVEPLHLRSFTIQPLDMLLSVHTSMRLYIALDHSPLSFSRYECQQMLTVPLRFGQSLGMHYLSGAIFGAGWVVGSLEILGSPSGLARSFSTGLRDFISMPVQGLFRGPWGFVVGITQGSASLFRNVTAGTVNSVTKLASSVARNLDRLTLDQEHIERTEALRRSRPQGFAEGLTQGMTGLGISILGAVGGLAHHTLEARTSVDVITGLTKGIVGAFAKPISGAAEMLALAGQGMLHTVGFNAMPQQVEPCISRNMSVNPSAYRIWQLLPTELHSDQVLFYHPITLHVQEQLRPAYAFLTSTVLALLEADNDKLAFVASLDVVELVPDREDRTKYYLRQVQERRSNDFEEHLNYTNQRIMKFLNSSRNDYITTESLDDLLNPNEANSDRNTDWVFYIRENLGEHLMHYLKVINKIN